VRSAGVPPAVRWASHPPIGPAGGRRYIRVKCRQGIRVEQNPESPAPRSLFRGGASLIIAAALVFILLVWLPAYRWFFLGSLGIGIIVAAVLYFWNKYKPVRVEDVENKRPLGLD
jgi:hypothetical protein